MLKVGAGRVHFGPGVLSGLAEEMKLHSRRCLLIGGRGALDAVKPYLAPLTQEGGIAYQTAVFPGQCSDAVIESLYDEARAFRADGILGIGGGKALDTAKAVAGRLNQRAVLVPTSAATCACWASTSIVYTPEGTVHKGISHPFPQAAVILDTDVLCSAPPRLLAAGMADALAKYFEIYYHVNGDAEKGRDGFTLMAALNITEFVKDIILEKGREAYGDNQMRVNSPAFHDIVYSNTVLTGTANGLYPNHGALAIAHCVHNILLEGFPSRSHQFLHGELVGVGVFVQMMINGQWDLLSEFEDLFRALGLPVSFGDLGIADDREALDLLAGSLWRLLEEGADSYHVVRDAIRRCMTADWQHH